MPRGRLRSRGPCVRRIGPQPRVLSDDVWAKLLWAGLNLDEGDLPAAWITRGFYPITMVRAMAIVWLFAGLRQDEIRRLRVGCIRVRARHPRQVPRPCVCSTCP